MTAEYFGATPEEWGHFDLVLGLGPDLLPVVSNPRAVISPQSKMKALGKVPSRYNQQHQVAGIANWTSHVATEAEIAKWSSDSDLGICVQTRTVRAIDVDIDDHDQALAIAVEINRHLPQDVALPRRRRVGSTKFLLAFTLPGDQAKRVIKAANGIVEFLATGQQFIAIGTHPSGERYEWESGLPQEIPTLTLEQFDALWSTLERRFAIEPSTTARVSGKAAKLADAAVNDPVAVKLHARSLVKSTQPDGRINVVCPFEAEHERESDDTATTYFPANTGGYARGHFHCLHSPCEGRSDADFLRAIGIVEDHRDDFEAVGVPAVGTIVLPPNRFVIVGEEAFSAGVPPGWIVKGLLPRGELGVIYGPPGSGKSFWALDLAECIARGVPWRDLRVTQGDVVYIAAEGASFFRNRITAYRKRHSIPTGARGIHVLAGVPNLMIKQDVVDLGNSIRTFGKPSVVIYDTLARGVTGADENSAKDMGIAIANCRTLHDVTNGMMVLIGHTGKDTAKGMRGSNAPLGAVDVEIEISREDENRIARLSKLKDGEDQKLFGFKLNTVSVGIDEDGDDISSCTVEQCEAVESRPKVKRLGHRMDLVWRLAKDLQQPDDLGAIVKDIVAGYKAETPAPSGRDQREAHVLSALESLASMRKLKSVAPDRIVLLGGDE